MEELLGAATAGLLAACGVVCWAGLLLRPRPPKSEIKQAAGESLTPFQAVSTALATTVGTGNIAGVAVALALGGPGALAWLWIAGLLGMGTKYTEIYLSARWRPRDTRPGGPMAVMEALLPRCGRLLAVRFCIGCMAAGLLSGALFQTKCIVGAVRTLSEALSQNTGPVFPAWTAAPLAALAVWAMIRGGDRRVGRASAVLVPVMCLCYVAGCGAVLWHFRQGLPAVLQDVIFGAFSPRSAVFGGGAALAQGFRRGLYSNEAGLGSAPLAHARTAPGDPHRQGLYGMIEVAVDTLLLCTLTGLTLLTAGGALSASDPVGSCVAAFGAVFGMRGAALFLGVVTVLFALSSLFGWSLYGSGAAAYLWGAAGERRYPVFLCLTVTLAPLIPGSGVIPADAGNLVMCLPNLFCVLYAVCLGKEVFSSGAARRVFSLTFFPAVCNMRLTPTDGRPPREKSHAHIRHQARGHQNVPAGE